MISSELRRSRAGPDDGRSRVGALTEIAQRWDDVAGATYAYGPKTLSLSVKARWRPLNCSHSQGETSTILLTVNEAQERTDWMRCQRTMVRRHDVGGAIRTPPFRARHGHRRAQVGRE